MGAPTWTKEEMGALEKTVEQLGENGTPRKFMGVLRKLGFKRNFGAAFSRMKSPHSPQHALWGKLTAKQQEAFGSANYRAHAKASKVAGKRKRLGEKAAKSTARLPDAPSDKAVERIERVLLAMTRFVEAIR